MISFQDLARDLAEQHDIDTQAAAEAVVRAHVDQIADDSSLWDSTSEALTTEGEDLVREAVAASYAAGYHATTALTLLDSIADQTVEIGKAEAALADLVAERNALIQAALKTELARGDIAAAAGMK